MSPTMKFYAVPAGTRPTTCKGQTCGKRCYWIRTPTGRPLLIDCDVEGGAHPSASTDTSQTDLLDGATAVHDGRGVSHFQACVNADRF
jgi:hypothetical protein